MSETELRDQYIERLVAEKDRLERLVCGLQAEKEHLLEVEDWLAAQRNQFSAALRHIHTLAEEDIRRGRHPHDSHVWSISAAASRALGITVPQQPDADTAMPDLIGKEDF